MFWIWRGAGLIGLFFCAQVTLAEELPVPECVWEGNRQRPLELILPCTRKLMKGGLSGEERAAALFTRGRAYHNLMQLDPALQDYDDALALTPFNDKILVSRSDIFLRQGLFRMQLVDLMKALNTNPENTDALISVGRVYSRAGLPHKAIDSYSRAIELDPNKTFAFLRRKDEHLAQNDLPKALLDADEAVRASQLPDQPSYFENGSVARDIHIVALIERARLREKTGDMQGSAQDYEAAAAKDSSAYALIKRVTDMKRGAAADIPDLQEAIRREPENTSAIYSLGLRLMGERSDAALIAFNRALEINPYHSYALWMRARVHRGRGNTEQAARDMLRAIEIDRDVLAAAMPGLRAAGYWHSPKVPPVITSALEDAFRACMIDTRCN